MKAATSNEIKQQLKTLPAPELVELCLRLARFKKENKELLTYLLFESEDLDLYISQVKEEITKGFGEINTSHVYFAKKTLRRMLRQINKHVRYTGSRQAEVEWLIHYGLHLQSSGLPYQKNTALQNLFKAQLKKIKAGIGSMHEDLQYDYQRQLDLLEE